MSVINQKLTFFKPELNSVIKLPFISHSVSAGFPSPAMDFMEASIDLNQVLVENPIATFYVQVEGNSMIDAGIHDKDLLVVDRSLEPRNNKIAICLLDGEFTVKRIRLENNELYLMPENPSYQPIQVTEENQLIIWGIVTYVIKKL
ncbi:LexA family protein [Flavobacterium sp.]|jgi:DNA polymerase V|uniref:LexA family protein n=1 Tax=Flavobacterium sp. TaxID=239 RepID=UPI0037BF5D4A